MTTTNSELQDAASAENRARGEERAKGEEKSNRNNPTFKNRRNPVTQKEKTFSNRDRNGISGLPHFRPWERHSPEWRPVSRLVVGLPRQSGDWRSRENQNVLDPIRPVDDDFGARRNRKVRS
jgi:hypothetical protein